jgi:hypothetical protein
VRGCGNLKSYPDQLIDAIIFGRDLGEDEESISEERFDKIRFYLKNGKYPNGADRAEKSRLRSAATHYKLIPSSDGQPERLMLKGKEVIAEPARQYEIARQVHFQNHGGINKSTAAIAERYHWVRIKETVSAVIKNCGICNDMSKAVARPEQFYRRSDGLMANNESGFAPASAPPYGPVSEGYNSGTVQFQPQLQLQSPSSVEVQQPGPNSQPHPPFLYPHVQEQSPSRRDNYEAAKSASAPLGTSPATTTTLPLISNIPQFEDRIYPESDRGHQNIPMGQQHGLPLDPQLWHQFQYPPSPPRFAQSMPPQAVVPFNVRRNSENIEISRITTDAEWQAREFCREPSVGQPERPENSDLPPHTQAPMSPSKDKVLNSARSEENSGDTANIPSLTDITVTGKEHESTNEPLDMLVDSPREMNEPPAGAVSPSASKDHATVAAPKADEEANSATEPATSGELPHENHPPEEARSLEPIIEQDAWMNTHNAPNSLSAEADPPVNRKSPAVNAKDTSHLDGAEMPTADTVDGRGPSEADEIPPDELGEVIIPRPKAEINHRHLRGRKSSSANRTRSESPSAQLFRESLSQYDEPPRSTPSGKVKPSHFGNDKSPGSIRARKKRKRWI